MELTDTLLSHFEALQDPRTNNHNQLHDFHDILIMAILGTICGADGWTEICQFAESRENWLKTFLRLPNGIPSHDTFGRVFSLLKPDTFESCFLSWIESLSIDVKNEIIAIDGKSLRGSHDAKKNVKMLHMVSAWASNNRMMLGQIKTEDKSNEITAIPKLLEMINTKESIVTIDAMGCQKEIAKKIVEGKADYVLSLKDNHPTLHNSVASIFEKAKAIQYTGIMHKQRVETLRSHGRIEKRRYVLIIPREKETFALNWPHLKAIGMVEIKRTVNNKVERSKRYFLTSLDDGCKLFQMSRLPKETLPEEGKVYVEQVNGKLRYLLSNPSGEVVDGFLDIKIPNCGVKTLKESRLRILAEIGKRHHFLLDNNIKKFMEAVRKHWNIEINLHWSLDVSFKEDLSRVRIGHASQNLGAIRRIALNLLKQEKTSKVGITARRKRAGWDNQYLLKVLMSDSHFKDRKT